MKTILGKFGRRLEVSPADPETRIDHDLWPMWAIWFEGKKRDGEIGVGDTAKRFFSYVGGEQYREISKLVGLPCHCPEKQNEWNIKFPYQ